jgi:hypothetical protein
MSERMIEFLRAYKHDPILSRLPMPEAVREALELKQPSASKNIMEAADTYMSVSCLPATAQHIDGTIEHKDVVFPEIKPVEPTA